MEQNQFGNCSLRFLRTYHSQLSLRIRYFVFMADCHPKFSSLTKLKPSIEFRIFLTKELFAIYFGRILLTKGRWDSDHLLEEQAFVGARISATNLLIEII